MSSKHDTILADTVSKSRIISLTKEQAEDLKFRLKENKLTKEDLLFLENLLSNRKIKILFSICKKLLKAKKLINSTYFLILRGFLCLKQKIRGRR